MMKRNPRLREQLIRSGKGFKAGVDLIFELPVLFEKHGLVVNGDITSIIGSFAMIAPKLKQYAVFNMVTMLPINPKELTVVEKDGIKYYNYLFDKGQVVFPSSEVIQRGGVLYSIMNLYLFHSNQPWFLTTVDLFNLLNSSSHYAKINTDASPEINEVFIALAARVKGKLDTLHKNGGPNAKLEWVSLADVAFLKSMFAKITNNYQAQGMVSALISEPNKPSNIERVVRA